MISVIIPVYNVEKYLDKCLESVLTNTYQNLEVICVNDGSTDNSLDILDKWEKKDSRIYIISHENRGLPEARNSGLEVATGEYTAFIDSDDWVHPRYFESLLNCMEESNADMVICGYQRINPDEILEINYNSKAHYKRLTAREFYRNYHARHMIWARLIRSRDTGNLRFPPEVDQSQDTLYNHRLISSWEQPVVYATETPMYYYLQRPGSLARSRTYETRLQMSDWYVANGLDPYHIKTGEWGWIPLLHSIAFCLSCRYQAKLRKDQKVINHVNELLQILISDMLKDGYICPKDKIARIICYLLPCTYRFFRFINGTSISKTDREN